MNSDFRDLLQLFARHEVRCLVVGGYAVMHYSQPRFTKDLDLWLQPSSENASRVMRAFGEFGMRLIDVTPKDFEASALTRSGVHVHRFSSVHLATRAPGSMAKCTWQEVGEFRVDTRFSQ